MADALETANVKLVTIIAPITLADAIASDLRDLGVSGCTMAKVEGWGKHGARQFGLNDEPNIRVETLVSAEVCRTILASVDAKAAEQGLVAFALDVEAVPRRHFA